MLESNIKPDVQTYSMLVDMFCKDGCVDQALSILKHMIEKGLTIFYEMFRKGITPDVVCYNTLIDGLCKANRLSLVHKLFREMRAHGIAPVVITYASLLDYLYKTARLDEAAGQLEDAENFFSNLLSKGLQPDIRTYNIMIKGFCKKGLMSEVGQVLRIMEEDGCPPDDRTYNIIIRGYILNNDLSKAFYYCDIMTSKKFEADADTFSLFVDLLSSGNLSDSSKDLLRKFIS
uniref:Pentatricopeptide repeat-containing protein n=1 Tax=Chenopodium quinoa TaxID=63459 RepID=A0A803KP88_CHEQI